MKWKENLETVLPSNVGGDLVADYPTSKLALFR